MMNPFPDDITVKDARDAFFGRYGFGADGGYSKIIVFYGFGPLRLIPVPNLPARRRAIPLHDLNHLATGYCVRMSGEAQIGAWELGSGCGSYWAAWFFNFLAFSLGLFLAPVQVFTAFVRGRHSLSLYTLYREGFRDDLLDLTLGELRNRLRLPREKGNANVADVFAFSGWVCLALLIFALPSLMFVGIFR